MIEIDLRDIFLFGHLETRTNYFFILKKNFIILRAIFLCAKMMTRHAIYLFYLNILYFYHIDISKPIFIETFSFFWKYISDKNLLRIKFEIK